MGDIPSFLRLTNYYLCSAR